MKNRINLTAKLYNNINYLKLFSSIFLIFVRSVIDIIIKKYYKV